MKLSEIKPVQVLLVLLVTLALLFGGQYLYRHYTYDQPLVEQLTAIEGVSDYQVVSENGVRRVMVEMRQVNNLQDTYLEVADTVERIYGNAPEIVVKDNANEKLEAVWYQSQFAIYQGISSGEFVEMNRQLKAVTSAQTEVELKVFVDADHVYFQTTDGQRALYRVIDRGQGGEPVA